jgi:formylglycine-generating enzyme required for sulfatase activity
VADFRLDKYEVTVGRFRQFKAAWEGGWRPSAGAGKHTHLNGGSGLASEGVPSTYEQGWDPEWDVGVAPTDRNLGCHAVYATWTPAPGANETKPINCVSWYDSYAFCIWDAGFLPSHAEWRYAAAGGAEQRRYPWGEEELGWDTHLAVWACIFDGVSGCSSDDIAPVGSVPAGNGKYGHADLVGNVEEWVRDLVAFTDGRLDNPCNNCARLTGNDAFRTDMGGNFWQGPGSELSPGVASPDSTVHLRGMRCARAP